MVVTDESPESTPILRQSVESFRSEDRDAAQSKRLYLILPVAFFSSMGMSATSATTIFAYETLMCEDPSNCHGEEKDRYAATVALSVTIANVCGILVLGLLPLLPRNKPKAALWFWLICRSSSVAILALGVRQNSVLVALCGRVFEGFATDNILQLALNTIYISAPQPSQVSQLFGVSLSLYMLGQALSPSIAGAFTNFTTSFAFGIGIFAVCTIYLWLLPPLKIVQEITEEASGDERQERARNGRKRSVIAGIAAAIGKSLIDPLKMLAMQPLLWGPGLALLFFLAAISYMYPALMVFAAMRFNFTGKENGWIVSTAATSSGVYLLLVHFVWAKLRPPGISHDQHGSSQRRLVLGPNLWYAMASMALLGGVIPLLGLTWKSWQLFPLVAVASMGLSTPSFIKSYAVDLVTDGTRTLTALALMETCGALLSPIILGSAQHKLSEGLIFTVSSVMVAAAMLFFALGAFIHALPAQGFVTRVTSARRNVDGRPRFR